MQDRLEVLEAFLLSVRRVYIIGKEEIFHVTGKDKCFSFISPLFFLSMIIIDINGWTIFENLQNLVIIIWTK